MTLALQTNFRPREGSFMVKLQTHTIVIGHGNANERFLTKTIMAHESLI